jgi:hypothetical protein
VSAVALLDDRFIPDVRIVSKHFRPDFSVTDILKQHRQLIHTTSQTDRVPAQVAKLSSIQDGLRLAGKPNPFVFRSGNITWKTPNGSPRTTQDSFFSTDFGVAAVFESSRSLNDTIAASASSVLGRLRRDDLNLSSAQITPQLAGSHNVQISVRGSVPVTGEPFVRRELVTFLAE